MAPHLFCFGGEDHHLRIPFLTALRERGFRVTAAGTGDSGPFSRAGLTYHQYEFDRFDAHSFPRKEMVRLGELVRAVRPDIIQSFDTKPNLLIPFAVRGRVPTFRTINGMGWVFSSASLRALALRVCYCALQRMASRWTSGTVFQNREDKEFFERYRLLGDSPAYLIGGSGVDLDRFPPPTSGTSTDDKERRPGVVITVSRLTKQKGILTLLEAADIVNRSDPEVRFVLVGPKETEGPFAVPQQEIDRRAPYVVALGIRSDVPELLRKADVFAFPSEYREGIPRALLEAGLTGLPIVATRIPGCTDVVTHGQNGYLVPPHNPQQLASRILDLLRDRTTAAAMGRRSIALVQREFSLTKVVEQYAQIYHQALNSPSFDYAAAIDGAVNPRATFGNGTR
jgi:glycosyltransferase involved in cell wall biosynthesis